MLYLSLRHYEYVAAIARHGSLSAAATEVNVSQPALSVALSRIETHLGHRLFLRRKGAPLVLTPRGRKFVSAAEDLLAQARRLETPGTPAPPTTRLDLGCFTDLAPFLLAPTLKSAREQAPDIDLRYHVEGFEGLVDALLKGRIDIAISFDLGFDDGFTRWPIGQAAPYALVAATDPIASQPEVMLADLTERPLILFEEGLSVHHVLQMVRRHGVKPVLAHRARSLEIMRSLAAHGEGIGVTYTLPPGDQSYDGTPVKAVRIADPGAAEPIVLVRHPDGGSEPQVGGLMETLARHLPHHLAGGQKMP